MSDEEQVIGVLRRCDVCERKTVHVGDRCREHKSLVRGAGSRDWFNNRTLIIPAIVAVALLFLAGFVHFVHGADRGVHMCWKDGWSLGDTFVDLDDLRWSQPSYKVANALDRCHL